MDRLTHRDDTGRAVLTLYGMRMYCSTQATADCFAELEEIVERTMHKWISVKEGLPEIGKNVLVCFGNGDMAVAYVIDTDEDLTLWRAITDEGWTGDCDAEPTYWMPLPEPPKEGGGEDG